MISSRNNQKKNKNPSHFKKLVLLSFVLLSIVLFNYQILKGGYFSQRARNNYVRAMPLPSLRGVIFDRRGEVLAQDRASFNIAVIPYQIKNEKDLFFKELAQSTGFDKRVIARNYRRNLRFYFSPTDIITNVSLEEALKLKEFYPETILINPRPQRKYSKPFELAHLLGYVKKASSLPEHFKKYGYTPFERIGVSGLEQYYDSYLRGQDGGDLLEVDARGNAVGFLGRKSPQEGKNIYLTINSKMQSIARESLNEKKGVLIFLDSNSGEILAMHSSPSFDSNLFVIGSNLNQYYQDNAKPLLNRAIQGSYPIGSLMKPILAVAGLEEGLVTPDKTFDCQGVFTLGRTRFRCSRAHGRQDLTQALANSCNVYFYRLGLKLGAEKIAAWSRRFGLEAKTKIDLPYEKEGTIPDPAWKRQRFNQSWYAGDTVNISIGQGYIQITPLAITMAINSLANGGYLIQPTLLKKIEDRPAVSSFKMPLDINSYNLKALRKGMREAVSSPGGTARQLRNLNLELAGKTGTAQTSQRPHAWFVGFFPYSKSNYTISVFLENGGSSSEAVKITANFLDKVKKAGLLELE